MILPAELERAVEGATFRDIHPAAIKAVEAGALTILDLLDALPWFRGAADWTAWRAFLAAVYALPMTAQEESIYRRATGRSEPPDLPALEVFCPTGRRARKSAIAALIAVFEGGFKDYSRFLAPGERAVIPIIGRNMEEAKQIAAYCKAILADDSLKYLLAEEPIEETISLVTRVDIRIRPASITAGRGKTIPLAELDEVAFFAHEGAAPDVEVVRAIKPGQASIPDAKLFALSSPFGKVGMLYEKHREYHGAKNEEAARRDRVLVWQAPTLWMHDTPQLRAVVADAYRKDPVAAEAEYGANFREDVEAFVLERVIDACTVPGRVVIPPGLHNYFAFVDVSGGSSDSFALCIAHHDLATRKVVQDCIFEQRAPFDPDAVVEEACGLLRQYDIAKVKGDAYGGKWPRARFDARGVQYWLSERSKSQIYQAFLPILNAGRVELLDHPRQRQQLMGLDRRVARGGRESIDHGTGEQDDCANSLAGSVVDADTIGPSLSPPLAKIPPPETVMEVFNRRIAEAMVVKESREEPNVYRRARR